jgi:hypothetical protein
MKELDVPDREEFDPVLQSRVLRHLNSTNVAFSDIELTLLRIPLAGTTPRTIARRRVGARPATNLTGRRCAPLSAVTARRSSTFRTAREFDPVLQSRVLRHLNSTNV